MNSKIFNNIAANEFFAQTVLNPPERTPFFERVGRCIGRSMGLFRNTNPGGSKNVYIYSEHDEAVDFGFALAAAAAYAGRYVVFITPTPRDFGPQLFCPAPNAHKRDAAAALDIINEHLYIQRSDAFLSRLGAEFAVIAPFNAYLHTPNLPHVAINYTREGSEEYFFAHFQCCEDGFALTACEREFFYLQNAAKALGFRQNEREISEEMVEFLLEHKLVDYSRISRTDELCGLLALRDIDGFGLSIREPCPLAIKLNKKLIRVDFSALGYQVPSRVKILPKPSF